MSLVDIGFRRRKVPVSMPRPAEGDFVTERMRLRGHRPVGFPVERASNLGPYYSQACGTCERSFGQAVGVSMLTFVNGKFTMGGIPACTGPHRPTLKERSQRALRRQP